MGVKRPTYIHGPSYDHLDPQRRLTNFTSSAIAQDYLSNALALLQTMQFLSFWPLEPLDGRIDHEQADQKRTAVKLVLMAIAALKKFLLTPAL